LPAYAKVFDVGLIPFRLNELTRAVNPIKLREYMSAGLPVVSTALPEVLRYRDFVSIAENAGDFIAACERIVAAGRVQGRSADRFDAGEKGPSRAAAARQTAMRTEDWAAKVAEIGRLVTRCTNGCRGSADAMSPPTAEQEQHAQ
jgi:hypothetical protein